MADTKKKKVNPVTKPFLKGSPTDENTWKSALGFFGIMILMCFMTFLVCSMTSLENTFLRILLNGAVVVLVLLIYEQRGLSTGAEAVAKGETMYQRQERGLNVAASERRLCYHPLKGFLTGLLGTLPFVLLAVVLAFTAQKTRTGYGTLPGWMEVYTRRSDIGGALVAYTNPAGLDFGDIIRVAGRLMMMPFVSLIGATHKDGLLILERLSPLVMLLPAIAYGLGYTRGVSVRTRVHTEIAENTKRRVRREKKQRKARALNLKPKGPQQLN